MLTRRRARVRQAAQKASPQVPARRVRSDAGGSTVSPFSVDVALQADGQDMRRDELRAAVPAQSSPPVKEELRCIRIVWPEAAIRTPAVSASFDGWMHHRMHAREQCHGFTLELQVPENETVRYKFLVDGVWRIDRTKTSGHGLSDDGRNHVVPPSASLSHGDTRCVPELKTETDKAPLGAGAERNPLEFERAGSLLGRAPLLMQSTAAKSAADTTMPRKNLYGSLPAGKLCRDQKQFGKANSTLPVRDDVQHVPLGIARETQKEKEHRALSFTEQAARVGLGLRGDPTSTKPSTDANDRAPCYKAAARRSIMMRMGLGQRRPRAFEQAVREEGASRGRTSEKPVHVSSTGLASEPGVLRPRHCPDLQLPSGRETDANTAALPAERLDACEPVSKENCTPVSLTTVLSERVERARPSISDMTGPIVRTMSIDHFTSGDENVRPNGAAPFSNPGKQSRGHLQKQRMSGSFGVMGRDGKASAGSHAKLWLHAPRAPRSSNRALGKVVVSAPTRIDQPIGPDDVHHKAQNWKEMARHLQDDLMDPVGAQELLRSAIEHRERHDLGWTYENAQVHVDLAKSLSKTKQLPQAEEHVRAALAIYERIGVEPRHVADLVHYTAVLVDRQRRRVDAESLYRRALAVYEQCGSECPNVAIARKNLELNLRRQRRAESTSAEPPRTAESMAQVS